MQIFDVYEVRKSDGGGGSRFAFYLSSKAEAELYAKTNTYDSVHSAKIMIFDSLVEVAEHELVETKRRVWDRLTDRERAAIGMPTRP